MDRLDSERENLAAAFAWCERSQRGAELAARLVSVLKYYWLSRGALATGYGYAVTAVQLAANRADVILQSRALSDAGTIATFLGRYADAQSHLERGLALARRSDDTEQEFVFLQSVGSGIGARQLRGCAQLLRRRRRAGIGSGQNPDAHGHPER